MRGHRELELAMHTSTVISEILYNSGVHISDPQDLATLAVFYDKVWLPYVPTHDVDLVEFSRSSDNTWKLSAFSVSDVVFMDGKSDKQWTTDRFTNDWDERHDSLFKAGVLQRVEQPPDDMRRLFYDNISPENGLGDLANVIDEIPFKLRGKLVIDNKKQEISYIWEDHIIHLLRTDLNMAAVFLLRGRAQRREIGKSVLANAVFSFCIPYLNMLNPEQILEVRRITADTRESFMAHLQGLSGNLDTIIKSGAKKKELVEAAADIVETKLIPDYLEFKRQLQFVRVGNARKILDPASKILEINASPLAPKFWYDLLRILYLGLSGAAEIRKDDLTNKTMAFNFMRKMQEQSARVPLR